MDSGGRDVRDTLNIKHDLIFILNYIYSKIGIVRFF